MLRTALVAALIAVCLGCPGGGDAAAPAQAARPPAPVEVAALRVGELIHRRTFSGTLEATRHFTVTPKVDGRLATLEVDIGDVVEDGAVIATIDDAELVQLVLQSEAELAVARAEHGEAESAYAVSERTLRRVESLSEQGITSQSELDTAQVNEFAARSHVEVTAARILRAEAALENARIQLGYAPVVASWGDGHGEAESAGAPGNGARRSRGDLRVVGQRFVAPGGFVSAGTPLVSIVDLDPIHAVVTVPERDYARLAVGVPATVVTDAHPDETFTGSIARLAPVFNRSTRQARVELVLDNADLRLRPGMFVRATLELQRVQDATVAPFAALAERGERTGVFVLDEEGTRVHWVPVEVGVRDGDDVALEGEGLAGLAAAGRRVVVLGQELCDDGSRVRTIDPPAREGSAPAAPAGAEAAR